MDFYEALENAKKNKILKIRDIAALLSKEYDAVRMAISRRSLSELEKREIIRTFKFDKSEQKRTEPYSTVNESEILMLSEPTLSQSKGAPYYDVDFIGGFDVVMNNQSVKPTFYIDFPGFNDVDCWINITGKSMSPFISHGDIVALKRLSNWNEFLLFGEIYAVVSDEFRTIKIIGKSEKDDCFKLIPYSKSPEFSEQDIPKSIIKEVYRVKGSLKKFF